MGLVRGGRGSRGAEARRERAFRALFDANHRAILAYALRRTASAQDAADLLGDVVLVAWRRIDDVPEGDAARLWLYGVARNALANHRRGGRRRDHLTERLASAIEPVVADPSEAVADRLWVRAALAELGDDDREVLTLAVWEGLAPREIAVVLDLPAATVRTRLHRARARMRTELLALVGERSGTSGHEGHDGRPPVRDTEEVK